MQLNKRHLSKRKFLSNDRTVFKVSSFGADDFREKDRNGTFRRQNPVRSLQEMIKMDCGGLLVIKIGPRNDEEDTGEGT